MESQKIANLIDDTSNQPSKFRIKNWVEINDESRGVYNVNSQIKFKTTMLKTSLCDYSDAYILVKGTITINRRGATVAAREADDRDKCVAFKNCAPFRDEPDDDLEDSESFKFKIKITGKTPNNSSEKEVEIMVPLKYLSNFWRTLEMPLINCEVNLILTWSSAYVVTDSKGVGRFAITDTKLYVPVVTLSTQENTKLLQQLKSGFKGVINWNKYLSNPELLAQNPNLNYLIEPSFQGVNRLFVLAFENNAQRTSHSNYFFSNVEIKDYNIMINGENFFDQPIKNNKVTYENRKIATGQGDDYTTGCLLDYSYMLRILTR